MLLTKDQIVSCDDLPYEDVMIPEWNGTVRVRTMTGIDRDAFERSIYDYDEERVRVNRENYRAKLLSRSLVDEKGNRLFTDKEVELLGKKSAKALDKLVSIAQRLNGMGKEASEDLEKK